MDFTEMLKKKFPYMDNADCDVIIGYVRELFLETLQVSEVPATKQYTFYETCVRAVEMAGMMSFESVSENGLNVVIDKVALLRDITPRVRRIKGDLYGVG